MSKKNLSKPTPNAHKSMPPPASARKCVSKIAVPPAKPKIVVADGAGKIGKIITMMRRPKGATIADLSKATDWQAHSIRGAISGMIKKKRGLAVTSEKLVNVRIYRIAG